MAEEARPTHAHGGERIGEASNPGPPQAPPAPEVEDWTVGGIIALSQNQQVAKLREMSNADGVYGERLVVDVVGGRIKIKKDHWKKMIFWDAAAAAKPTGVAHKAVQELLTAYNAQQAEERAKQARARKQQELEALRIKVCLSLPPCSHVVLFLGS